MKLSGSAESSWQSENAIWAAVSHGKSSPSGSLVTFLQPWNMRLMFTGSFGIFALKALERFTQLRNIWLKPEIWLKSAAHSMRFPLAVSHRFRS